jgi:lipoate-protein ligase A
MNLNGRWSGIATADGGPEGPVSMAVTFALSQKGENISGKAESNHKIYPILNGTVVANAIHFEIDSEDEYTRFDLTFDGERIRGNASTKRRNGVMLRGALSLSRLTPS